MRMQDKLGLLCSEQKLAFPAMPLQFAEPTFHQGKHFGKFQPLVCIGILGKVVSSELK